MMKAYPKIFSIGQDYIRDIFSDEVEITEKIDGSQFCFGRIEESLYMRSKGKEIFPEAPEKMFQEAIDYVLLLSLENRIPDNTVFYCEYLKNPKHNILAYQRVPHNHLALFGVSDHTDKFESKYSRLIDHAENLGIEPVPLIFRGIISDILQLQEMLKKRSILGNTDIEGIVAKNYEKPFLLGGQPIPVMAGKFVSEKYKETHRKDWKEGFTGKGRFDLFLESFRTEARWNKAVQRSEELAHLEHSPRDIGGLIKSIQQDIAEEEKDDVKNFLWSHFKQDIMRKAIAGFPEWYKNKLLERSMPTREIANG